MLLTLSGMRDVGEDLKEVGRALKDPLHSLGVLGDYAARKVKGYVAPQKLARVAPPLAAEAAVVANYARSTAGAVETLLRKYGKGVIAKEYQQERLANVVIDLYGALAVLSRASLAVAKGGEEKAADEIRLARAFIQGAKYRMVGHLKEMDKNRDEPQTVIADTAYAHLGYGFSYWA